jgi:hypothetical protein
MQTIHFVFIIVIQHVRNLTTSSNIQQKMVYLAKQFKRRRFLEINQPETRIANSSHVC